MKNILLLVGNGLTLDLISEFNLSINSSSPFSQKIPCLNPETFNILEYLPELNNYIKLKRNQNYINDFSICQDLINDLNNDKEKYLKVHCQMRHYFALCYSHMQRIFNNHIKNWNYINKFENIKNNIIGAISFNYDNNLEISLSNLGLKTYRHGVFNESGNIPIFKPHGSIDFDSHQNDFVFQTTDGKNDYLARLRNIVFLCETNRMRSINHVEQMFPRVMADIVLPSEDSPQKKLGWVKDTYNWHNTISAKLEHLVIIGISYWDCDKDEINTILENTSKNTIIHIINPYPSQDMINKITELNLSYTINSNILNQKL